jgi:insertion element IS1 protein InsB
MKCPKCESKVIVKNGHIHNGNPKFKCKGCGRQFVEEPQWRQVSDETKAQLQKLLRERISLAGIVRVTGVSARWLQSYVNALYAAQLQPATVRAKKNGS